MLFFNSTFSPSITNFERFTVSVPTKKVLDSAVANATNNYNMDVNALFVKEARVDAGPVMKRHMFDSRGRIGHNDKRTSHKVIVVADK